MTLTNGWRKLYSDLFSAPNIVKKTYLGGGEKCKLFVGIKPSYKDHLEDLGVKKR